VIVHGNNLEESCNIDLQGGFAVAKVTLSFENGDCSDGFEVTVETGLINIAFFDTINYTKLKT
jgi:hypothetical protein